MTAPFERCIQVLVDNLQSCFFTDETGRDRDAVAVVVLTAKMGYFGSPTEGATHMGIFVYGHLDTIARTTDNDATLELTLVEGATHLMSVIWIFATLTTVCSTIFYIESF